MKSAPVVVRLAGDFDVYNRDDLRALLEPAYDCSDAVIDLTEARYIDTTCLTELVALRKARADDGLPCVRLVVCDPGIRRLLNIVRFDGLFPIYDSMAEALGDTAASI